MNRQPAWIPRSAEILREIAQAIPVLLSHFPDVLAVADLISSFSKDKIVLLSTHIVSDVEYIADEILVMKDGRLIEQSALPPLCPYIRHRP